MTAIQEAQTVDELEAVWKELEAAGFAGPSEDNPHGGLTYQAAMRKRAELAGEPAPAFPEPPGINLPGISGECHFGAAPPEPVAATPVIFVRPVSEGVLLQFGSPENAQTPEELDALWANAAAQGYAGPTPGNPAGGLLYQSIERRREGLATKEGD